MLESYTTACTCITNTTNMNLSILNCSRGICRHAHHWSPETFLDLTACGKPYVTWMLLPDKCLSWLITRAFGLGFLRGERCVDADDYLSGKDETFVLCVHYERISHEALRLDSEMTPLPSRFGKHSQSLVFTVSPGEHVGACVDTLSMAIQPMDFRCVVVIWE